MPVSQRHGRHKDLRYDEVKANVILSDLVATAILIAYYAITCALLPTMLRLHTKAPAELVRKIQHVAHSLSIWILLRMFSTWYAAIAGALALALLAYPALLIMERFSWYQRAFVDRASGGGELRRSLIQAQVCFAILIAFFWGLLGQRGLHVIAVAVMGWGFGDAAAALVGKAWGRRRVVLRFVDGAKTREGTIAMALVAGLALFLTLRFYAGQPWYVSLLIALLVAPVCALVELFSRRGSDTFTVPLSAALVILPLLHLFSTAGW